MANTTMQIARFHLGSDLIQMNGAQSLDSRQKDLQKKGFQVLNFRTYASLNPKKAKLICGGSLIEMPSKLT